MQLKDIFYLQELKFYYKFLNNNLPVYLQQLHLIPNNSGHTIRGCSKLHITGINHKFTQRCLRHSLPHVTNSTPEVILNKIFTHSLHGFVNYVKAYLLEI